MHIKEICLEGFKSYATRTVVPGFDPYCNAITGLNGSGKSNIIDSICFVLGISNLQQVRAANLQELVYKLGQAGITKATVSVVFDNSNRSRSPIGYEDCPEITVSRQIVVGGRNKYLINGHLAQPSRVQNLFHSVQLNVDNPHFLIMQGRITKVLNMKPPEILSMLEEAAGTRMYETKKEAALKTLEKKQRKVDEIDKLLEHEILPALEKLRKESMQYMQWANGNAELDRLKRFCIAYEYVQAEKIRDDVVSLVEEIKTKISEIDKNAENMSTQVQEMERNISKLTSEKEATMGREVESLSAKVDGLSLDLVREESILKNQEETLIIEKGNAEKIVKNIEELEQSICDKNSAIKEAEDGAAGIKHKFEELSTKLEEYENDLKGVLDGKSNRNEDKCLEDQLTEAKVAVGHAETDMKLLKIRMRHYEKELEEKERQLSLRSEEAATVEKELKIRRNEVENVKKSMDSTLFKEGEMENLQSERTKEREMVQKLNDDIMILSSQLSNVVFKYRAPVKNFAGSKVKGVVAKLIKVNDSSMMTALEAVAGEKLYNVVVDTEETGKQLLQNGNLNRRVTIIPLNEIQSYPITSRVQSDAEKLVGSGNAAVALSLVGYAEELENAMEYVFGSTFVCKSTDAAREVAFNRKVGKPSVTIEGDIFQPSGLLTGGSHKDGGDLLRQLHALASAESELSVHQMKLSEIEDKISKLLPIERKFKDLKAQLEIKQYDLSLFESRAKQNEHHKLQELVAKICQELVDAKSGAEEKQQLHENCVNRVSTLEKAIQEHRNNRGNMLSELQKKIKEVETTMQSSSEELEGHQNATEKLILETEAVKKECADLKIELVSVREQTTTLETELKEHKTQISSIKKVHDEAQLELNTFRSKIKECTTQMNSIMREQGDLQKRKTEMNIERRKMENEVKRMELEQKDCYLKVAKLVEKHAWITSERNLFGKSGTDYDFASRDPSKARECFEGLQAKQSGLEKRINKKVMTIFERVEDEYNNLMTKKNIIESDKIKIQMVIEELDEKKKETLKVIWVKVNKDFGSIFSTLLPGTMAKLEPSEGGSFLDGLEVRVAFGSVWKQSLSELSGGQRSLLALSLILALLLFKPAPLYILDEVDAALDMSHTQNVGKIIKAHFPQSQFIVVSLKEGMFNNANVLFRTKFVDGVSTVQRTTVASE